MKVSYLIQQTFSFLAALLFLAEVGATSKPYQANGHITLQENTPCVYLDKKSPDNIRGIRLYEGVGNEILWADDGLIVGKERNNCTLLGGKIFIFQELKWYKVEIDAHYAVVDFCLASQNKKFYLAKQTDSGQCTLEAEEPPKPKMWWQKLFD